MSEGEKRVRKQAKKPSANTNENKGEAKHPGMANLRPWQPGESGNPSGRPAVIRELRDLAREKTSVAMETLIEVCSDKGAPPAARVAAAAHILDRGYGKPTQHVSQTVRHVQKMTDDELLAYLSGAESIEASSGEGAAAASIDQGKPH